MGKLSLSEIIKKKSSEPRVVKIPKNSVIPEPVFDEPSKDIEEITEKLKNFHISSEKPESKDVVELTEKLKNFHLSPVKETKIPKNSVNNDDDYIRKDENGNYVVDFPKYMKKEKNNIINYEIKKIPVIPKVSCGCSNKIVVPKISGSKAPISPIAIKAPVLMVPKISAPKVASKLISREDALKMFNFGNKSIPKVSSKPTIKFVRAKDDSNEQYKFSKIPSQMKKFTIKSN